MALIAYVVKSMFRVGQARCGGGQPATIRSRRLLVASGRSYAADRIVSMCRSQVNSGFQLPRFWSTTFLLVRSGHMGNRLFRRHG